MVEFDEVGLGEERSAAGFECRGPLLEFLARGELHVPVYHGRASSAGGARPRTEVVQLVDGTPRAVGSKRLEELVARILDEDVCELEGEQLDVGVVVTEAGDEFESGFRGRDARGSDRVGEAEGGVQVERGLGGQEVRSALLCVRACGWTGGG